MRKKRRSVKLPKILKECTNAKIQKVKDIGQDEESVESDSEEEEEGERRWNPYTEFLENIEDEGSEEEVSIENYHRHHHQRRIGGAANL